LMGPSAVRDQIGHQDWASNRRLTPASTARSHKRSHPGDGTCTLRSAAERSSTICHPCRRSRVRVPSPPLPDLPAKRLIPEILPRVMVASVNGVGQRSGMVGATSVDECYGRFRRRSLARAGRCPSTEIIENVGTAHENTPVRRLNDGTPIFGPIGSIVTDGEQPALRPVDSQQSIVRGSPPASSGCWERAPRDTAGPPGFG
jgi:hypothetical protein